MTVAAAPDTGSSVQLASVGLLAAVGASPAQAASGLMALCIGQGLLALWLGWRTRVPISIA